MQENRKVVVRKKKGASLASMERRKRKRAEAEKIRIRNMDCLELRRTGATFEMIARQFSLHDASHAKKCVMQAIETVEVTAAKDVVRMDLLTIDEMQMRCTHALRQNGDLHQIDRILRLMEFRYRLLGVTDETVRAMQGEHGIATTTNVKNQVMVIQASPESEDEFIGKMMRAVGIDPTTDEARKYVEMHEKSQGKKELPMLKGSANEDVDLTGTQLLTDDDIVDAEIVED